jgi:ribose transport system substrate-binding protein
MHRGAVSSLATVLATLALVGATPTLAQEADQTATADLAGITVAYVDGLKGLPFFTSVHCGAQDRAAELGINYQHDGPAQFDATLQIPILNAVGARSPDAIILSPTDTQALIAPMQALAEQGIELVTVDTTVEDADLTASRILSDNVGGGRLAADTLAGLLGEQGKVVVLGVKPGISTTDERGQGFEEAIASYPDIEYLGIQYNQGSDATAQQVLTGVISANPDLAGIFIPGNVGSEGAAAALRSADLGDSVKVVQYDASPPQVEQLRQGLFEALIAQDPYQEGRDAVDQAVAAILGEENTPEVLTALNVITREGVDTEGPLYQYKVEC